MKIQDKIEVLVLFTAVGNNGFFVPTHGNPSIHAWREGFRDAHHYLIDEIYELVTEFQLGYRVNISLQMMISTERAPCKFLSSTVSRKQE